MLTVGQEVSENFINAVESILNEAADRQCDCEAEGCTAHEGIGCEEKGKTKLEAYGHKYRVCDKCLEFHVKNPKVKVLKEDLGGIAGGLPDNSNGIAPLTTTKPTGLLKTPKVKPTPKTHNQGKSGLMQTNEGVDLSEGLLHKLASKIKNRADEHELRKSGLKFCASCNKTGGTVGHDCPKCYGTGFGFLREDLVEKNDWPSVELHVHDRGFAPNENKGPLTGLGFTGKRYYRDKDGHSLKVSTIANQVEKWHHANGKGEEVASGRGYDSIKKHLMNEEAQEIANSIPTPQKPYPSTDHKALLTAEGRKEYHCQDCDTDFGERDHNAKIGPEGVPSACSKCGSSNFSLNGKVVSEASNHYIICSKCKAKNPPTRNTCQKCGAKLPSIHESKSVKVGKHEVHVKPTDTKNEKGMPLYRVIALGNKVASKGLKNGEELTDTQLDDLEQTGHPIKHLINEEVSTRDRKRVKVKTPEGKTAWRTIVSDRKVLREDVLEDGSVITEETFYCLCGEPSTDQGTLCEECSGMKHKKRMKKLRKKHPDFHFGEEVVMEMKNHMGENELQTYGAWKKAVKKVHPDATIEGDKDIAHAKHPEGHDIGEWEGDKGVVYGNKHLKEAVKSYKQFLAEGKKINFVNCAKCGQQDKPTPAKWDEKREKVLQPVNAGTSVTMRCPDCAAQGDPFAMLCRKCCPTGHGTKWEVTEEVITETTKHHEDVLGAHGFHMVKKEPGNSENESIKVWHHHTGSGGIGGTKPGGEVTTFRHNKDPENKNKHGWTVAIPTDRFEKQEHHIDKIPKQHQAKEYDTSGAYGAVTMIDGVGKKSLRHHLKALGFKAKDNVTEEVIMEGDNDLINARSCPGCGHIGLPEHFVKGNRLACPKCGQQNNAQNGQVTRKQAIKMGFIKE